MVKNANNHSPQSDSSRLNPIIQDPWDTTESKTARQFPSPLELDRLLREPHPLMKAAERHLELTSGGAPGAELLPAHTGGEAVNPLEVLLKNELKLPANRLDVLKGERLRTQMEKALALLYWLASKSTQAFA